MTKRMVLMLAAVGLVFGGIFGFKAWLGAFLNDMFDNMPAPPVTITAAEVREDRWVPAAEAVGSFGAVNGAELALEVGGIVAGIHFDNGQRVARGQRMVSLETEADEAELERLQAAARLTDLERARFERLYTQRNVSEAEVERARSEAAQARAAVNVQQAQVRQKTLRAPFAGIAGIRRVNVGQYLPPGDPVVALQSLDPIFLDFSLPEQRLPQIDTGQILTVRVDAYAGERFNGEITAIEPRVQESSRTFQIQATFDNPEGKLRPGMFGRVEVATGAAASLLVVPQSAIQFNPYGNAVFVVVEDEDGEGMRVSQRFVRTGRTRGDLVAVLDGLESGDRVATSGLLKLRNHAPVNINDDDALQPDAEANPRPVNR